MRLLRRAWAVLRRRAVWLPVAVLVVGLAGAAVAVNLAGSVTREVGPVQVRFSLDPGIQGGVVIALPPLGTLQLDTHDGPLRIDAKPTGVDVDQARGLLQDPGAVGRLENVVADDARGAVMALGIKAGLLALAGAGVLAAVVFRRWIPVAGAMGVTLLAVGISAGTAALSFTPSAVAEPHYTGLLTEAPTVIGSFQNIVDRFGKYSAELAKLVTNVSRLYDVTSTLPAFAPKSDTIRVLHVSDIHDNPAAGGIIRSAVKQFDVDAVLDTGDITDHGTKAEDKLFGFIKTLGVPYVYIRGNHDSVTNQQAIAKIKNAVVLDGNAATVAGLRIFGSGDPRFTPDKTTHDDNVGTAALERNGRQVADEIAAAEPPPVDIAMVHDPIVGSQLGGTVPLVLAGHIHHRARHWLADGKTLMLVEGSTGAAGLRGLEGDQPTPFEMDVLYFSATTHRLQAYDDITLGGLGESSVQIDRHVVKPPGKGSPTPSPSPSPSGSGSVPPSPRPSGSGSASPSPSASGSGRRSAAGPGTPSALVSEPVVAYASHVSSGRRRGPG